MSAEETQQLFLQTRQQYEDFIFIYTDGSKADNRTSNAVFVLSKVKPPNKHAFKITPAYTLQNYMPCLKP